MKSVFFGNIFLSLKVTSQLYNQKNINDFRYVLSRYIPITKIFCIIICNNRSVLVINNR